MIRSAFGRPKTRSLATIKAWFVKTMVAIRATHLFISNREVRHARSTCCPVGIPPMIESIAAGSGPAFSGTKAVSRQSTCISHPRRPAEVFSRDARQICAHV
jgi:hypothetical protein